MLRHVAVRTKRHKATKGVVAQLAPLDLVVNLQILQGAALLTSPAVALQHPLHQPPVILLPQLDPLYLRQHFPAVSTSLPALCPATHA
jgi:hypothetical protein